MLNISTHRFLIELLFTIGDGWQCHHSSELNSTLRTYSSQWLARMSAWWEGPMLWELISHLEKPLILLTRACSYIRWCQAKTGHITVLSLWLRSFYKYSPVSWFTNPLMAHKRCPNLCVRMCQMLSPGLLPTNVMGEGRSDEELG